MDNVISITEKHLDKLSELKFYFRPRFNHGNALGKTIRIRNKVLVEEYARISERSLTWGKDVEIGAFSYIAPNSRLPNTVIGRHCSIGMFVEIFGEDHPLDRVTTSTWTYGNNIKQVVMKDFDIEIKQDRSFAPSRKTIIGHDVWIGDNVKIKGGVNIGHGAIIGANAVVAKNVAAYSIVVGNPIREIKYRFDENIISELLKTQWWNISPHSLAKLNTIDVNEFLINFEEDSTPYVYNKFYLNDCLI